MLSMICHQPSREEFLDISEVYIRQYGFHAKRESKAGNEFKVCLLKAKSRENFLFSLKNGKSFQDFT